jgi:hypothetical protein
MNFWEKRLEEIKTEPFNQFGDRESRHIEQYKQNGFDDSDTWGLDYHLATLILPRLIRYKELAENVIVIDFPLDEMIKAFKLYIEIDSFYWTKEDKTSISEGLKAFGEHYHQLWW